MKKISNFCTLTILLFPFSFFTNGEQVKITDKLPLLLNEDDLIYIGYTQKKDHVLCGGYTHNSRYKTGIKINI